MFFNNHDLIPVLASQVYQVNKRVRAERQEDFNENKYSQEQTLVSIIDNCSVRTATLLIAGAATRSDITAPLKAELPTA